MTSNAVKIVKLEMLMEKVQSLLENEPSGDLDLRRCYEREMKELQGEYKGLVGKPYHIKKREYTNK